MGSIRMSPLVSLLAEVPLFQLLDADERAALAQMMEQANFPAGHRIFGEGEPGDRMFVVCSGEVELTTTDKLGQRLVLTTASRGDLFGELSLLDQGARNARATVLEDAQLLILTARRLLIHPPAPGRGVGHDGGHGRPHARHHQPSAADGDAQRKRGDGDQGDGA
jgi:hypothetical protein